MEVDILICPIFMKQIDGKAENHNEFSDFVVVTCYTGTQLENVRNSNKNVHQGH